MYGRIGIRLSGQNFGRGAKMALGGIALAMLILLVLSGEARGSTYGRTVASFSFTTHQPSGSTGYTLAIHYQNAQDPNAKPPNFHELDIHLPQGTHFDLGVVPACSASDSQIMAEGPSACPSASRVGGGTVTLISGFGPPVDPIAADVAIFQGQGDLLDVFSKHGSSQVLAVDHVKIQGSTLIDQPQSVPGGPPDGRSAVRDVNLQVAARSASGRAYITTPPSCPAAGWESSFIVSYDDGVIDTALSTAPCVASVVSTGAIHVSLAPRRIRAGKNARLRVTLSSNDPTCIDRATVRLLGHRPVHSDSTGNATIVAILRGHGRRKVIASKPGCRSGSASITVLPPSPHTRPPRDQGGAARRDHDGDYDGD